MDRLSHWETLYRNRSAETLSWYQPVPAASLEFIERLAPDRASAIIDVGTGASRLVESLLDTGYQDITVLDVAENAMGIGRARLGERARQVHWIHADVTEFEAERQYHLWHDRAVFHFLIDAADRAAYLAALGRALEPDGWCVMATFAMDGPDRCSGLPVRRYDEERLSAALGADFELCESRRETHVTPAGATQEFIWFVARHR